MDRKVDAINAHGMIAVPVALWAFGPDDPGQALAEVDAVRLALPAGAMGSAPDDLDPG